MSLLNALIGTLALSSLASASSEVAAPQSEEVKEHAVLSQLHHEKTHELLSLIAPKDWKNKRFSYVHPKEEAANGKDRNLRERPRNPTYKPSNNDKGYFMMTLFNDKNADGTMDAMCTAGNEFAMMGLEVGSCFAAREYHGTAVLGSFKVGIVEASSGRNHVHVESYTAHDCTGPARRTSNHMSRIHFDEGGKVAPVDDPRSRHYWVGEDNDDVDAIFQPTCIEYSHHMSATAPFDTSCIPDARFVGHSIKPNCADDEYIFFYAIQERWDECVERDGHTIKATCEIPTGDVRWTLYGTWDEPTQTYTSDATCTVTPTLHEDHVPAQCRAFTPQVSGTPPLPGSNNDDDDDFGGGPMKQDDGYNPYWNVRGHADYDPFYNTIFNASPEGGYIQGSSLYVRTGCWNGVQPVCSGTP